MTAEPWVFVEQFAPYRGAAKRMGVRAARDAATFTQTPYALEV